MHIIFLKVSKNIRIQRIALVIALDESRTYQNYISFEI